VNLNYPEFIEEKLAQLREKGGTTVCNDKNYTYVLLALGERRTGGYSIEVVGAEEKVSPTEKEVLIKAKERKPHPGDMVIQVITYPVAVYRLPLTDLPVKVEWVRGY
jgi:hypothetical protein